MSKIMYLIRVQQGVIGFADENGLGLGSFIIDTGKETRRSIEQKFVSRFSSQRHNIKGKNHFVDGRWEFVWLDFNTIAKLEQPDLDLPEVKNKSKSKIYEIVNQDKGFLIVKHDKELLDEDEVKERLFENSVE